MKSKSIVVKHFNNEFDHQTQNWGGFQSKPFKGHISLRKLLEAKVGQIYESGHFFLQPYIIKQTKRHL